MNNYWDSFDCEVQCEELDLLFLRLAMSKNGALVEWLKTPVSKTGNHGFESHPRHQNLIL